VFAHWLKEKTAIPAAEVSVFAFLCLLRET